MNDTYGDVNGGKISVSDWFEGITNEVPWTRSWTSITEGANQTIEQGKAANFRSSGDIKDFQKVLIDGKELPESNYTIKSGSTIVTLNTEYTKTLTAGRHTISIVSKTGHANAEFTIKAVSTPAAPTLGTPVLKAQSLEYNTIGLQWNKIDRASGYIVYRRYKNNGCGDGCYSKWKMITEVNDSLQFQDTHAVTGRQYQYMIKAYMNEGTKHIYSPMSRFVSCKAVPSTPTVRARAYRNTTNKVSWSKTAGAQKYYIYRKTTSKNAKWEKIAVLKSNAQSFDDRKAKKGKKYIYAVRAYRREGCISYYSNYGTSKIVKTKR